MPTSQCFRNTIQKRNLSVDIGGNNSIADAGERRLKPFPLFIDFFLCAALVFCQVTDENSHRGK